MAMLILTGDVNLKGVTDAAVPLARVAEELRKADLVFSNLECLLGTPPSGHSHSNEGFFADPAVGAEVLTRAGIGVVGIANNVHYGEAINGSIAQLDRIGILHTGAGQKSRRCARSRHRGARRRPFWIPAAQLGLLADQSRGAQGRRRHRRHQGPYRLSDPDVPVEAGFLSAQPPRPAAGDHHLGGRRLSRGIQGGHCCAASAGRRAGGVVPLGSRP